MTGEELTEHWDNNFPDFPPEANQLKFKFNERWFRIHTLPESKRYPENEDEYNEIFRRHNLILSDLFGLDQTYYLLTTGFGYKRENLPKNKKVQKLGLQKNYWRHFLTDDDKDFEPFYAYLYFDERLWIENSMDKLFRLVTDEEAYEVMFFSVRKKILYHPYDGGADIILKNSELRDFYKEKYKDWLSKHPLGL